MNAETLQRLSEIELTFHRRAFGEEAARVNFLPAAERKAYLASLRERVARRAERASSREGDDGSPITRQSGKTAAKG
jgi:uncharacterized protein YueI